jgi:hypothetical protein
MISAESRGISFTAMLLMLAHYKFIDDNRALRYHSSLPLLMIAWMSFYGEEPNWFGWLTKSTRRFAEASSKHCTGDAGFSPSDPPRHHTAVWVSLKKWYIWLQCLLSLSKRVSLQDSQFQGQRSHLSIWHKCEIPWELDICLISQMLVRREAYIHHRPNNLIETPEQTHRQEHGPVLAAQSPRLLDLTALRDCNSILDFSWS